jgi:protoporphyrinogen oxidase
MAQAPDKPHTIVVGGGFTGLCAAFEISRQGLPVTVVEAAPQLGGLAGGFEVGGSILERFYHHWFTSDVHILRLVDELGLGGRVLRRSPRTGLYYANHFFRLSRPVDVLRFSPLRLIDRLRLGLLLLQARRVRDWRQLEALTAREWLTQLCGAEVYRVVWDPLLVGKFGNFSDEISAVWFWNKLLLRGSSRGRQGTEILYYFKGGFAALAYAIAQRIIDAGGELRTATRVTGIEREGRRITAVTTTTARLPADAVIFTPALPIIADILASHLPVDYIAALRRVKYLAVVCLVLELDHSLSDTYWLNVNDPSFPFVGVIEHTNFEPPASYNGRHIVYLSKYLPIDDPLYAMSSEQFLAFALPHLTRMFPAFSSRWIKGLHVWRAPYAQPIVERYYSKLIPAIQTPLDNALICTMAQIYPEDRGTNYAVCDGRRVGKLMAGYLKPDLRGSFAGSFLEGS